MISAESGRGRDPLTSSAAARSDGRRPVDGGLVSLAVCRQTEPVTRTPPAASGPTPPPGKLPGRDLERLVFPHLGARRDEVLVRPGAGLDCAIVKIGAGRVMALSTDPLSIVPALGAEASARLACHLLASDLWTSGIPPAHAAIDLNLPLDIIDDAL